MPLPVKFIIGFLIAMFIYVVIDPIINKDVKSTTSLIERMKGHFK